MSKQNQLIKLLTTFLKTYNTIDNIDFSEDNISFYDNNIIEEIIQNIDNLDIETLNSFLIEKLDENSQFWRNSINELIDYLNLNFIKYNQEHDTNYLDYSDDMYIVKNGEKININKLNNNFILISEGITFVSQSIFNELFGCNEQEGSPKTNKYFKIFTMFFKEFFSLWENIVYLWLSTIITLSRDKKDIIVKQIYISAKDFINLEDTSNSQKNLKYLLNILAPYTQEYPNSHLCLIPIIQFDNCELNNDFYAEEWYPGLFYHAPSFNNVLSTAKNKFVFYPFKSYEDTISDENFEPFSNNHFVKAGFNKDSLFNLYLGNSSYVYRIYNEHLYYAAPFSKVNQIREIIPKEYTTAINTTIDGNFSLKIDGHPINGELIIQNFKIKHYDLINNNFSTGASNVLNISEYKATTTTTNNAILNSSKIVKYINGEWIYEDKDYFLGSPIILEPKINTKQINQIRRRVRYFRGKTNFSFKMLQSNILSAKIRTIDEDYKNIIEYIPLVSTNNSNKITDNNLDDTSTAQDNLILTAYTDYDWDYLEENFVLGIGQHLNHDNVLSDASERDLINQYENLENRKYFTLSDNKCVQQIEQLNYYNFNFIDVGAFINIPFNSGHKNVIYYPNFLSHTFGTDNLIPLTCLELAPDSKENYFSYDNQLLRDYPINKENFLEIYINKRYNNEDNIVNFKTAFNSSQNDAWQIKITEVISQDTPTIETYCRNNNGIFDSSMFPPFKICSLKDLYDYYLNYGNKIENKNILTYFSQLAPIFESSNNLNQKYNLLKQQYKTHIKNDYENILSTFSNKPKETLTDEVYEGLTNILLDDNDLSFNYDSDEKKKITYSSLPNLEYFSYNNKIITNNKLNYGILKIYGNKNLLQEYQTNCQSIFPWKYKENDSEEIYLKFKAQYNDFPLDDIINNNDTTLYSISQIINDYCTQHSEDINTFTNKLKTLVSTGEEYTNEYLFNKNYTDKITNKTYNYPKIQNIKNEQLKIINSDECFNSFLIKNNLTNIKYLANGFGCIQRSEANQLNIQDTFQEDVKNGYNFEIFGLNFPLHKYITSKYPRAPYRKSEVPDSSLQKPEQLLVSGKTGNDGKWHPSEYFIDKYLDETYNDTIADAQQKYNLSTSVINYINNYDWKNISEYTKQIIAEELIEYYNLSSSTTNDLISILTSEIASAINFSKLSIADEASLLSQDVFKRWDADWWNYIQYPYPKSESINDDDIAEIDGTQINSSNASFSGIASALMKALGHFLQETPKYYSYFNPGLEVISTWNIPSSISVSTVQTLTLKDYLKPFYHIVYYFSSMFFDNTEQPSGEYKEIVTVQRRQYPHIYLMSTKTLIPTDYLRNKVKNVNIKYSSYIKDTSSNKYKYSNLSNYYSYSLIPSASLKEIPLIIPTIRESDATLNAQLHNLKNTVANEIKERTNFAYPSNDDIFSFNKSGSTNSNFSTYNKYSRLNKFIPTTKMNNQIKVDGSSIDWCALKKYYDIDNAWREIFYDTTSYNLPSPSFKKSIAKKNFDFSVHPIDENNSDASIYYYITDDTLNIDTSINYEVLNTKVDTLNLQIIEHWLGPNGKYARKVITRQIDNSNAFNENVFLTTDQNHGELIYNQWTNTWIYSYVGQEDNESTLLNDDTIFEDFNDNLSNFNLFVKSDNIKYSDNIDYDFMTYPNTGLSTEGSHTEIDNNQQ